MQQQPQLMAKSCRASLLAATTALVRRYDAVCSSVWTDDTLHHLHRIILPLSHSVTAILCCSNCGS